MLLCHPDTNIPLVKAEISWDRPQQPDNVCAVNVYGKTRWLAKMDNNDPFVSFIDTQPPYLFVLIFF